jgi:diguanylate cyclase (GGDEF)-like protein
MISAASGMDPVRTTVAQAALALFNAFHDADADTHSLSSRFALNLADEHPAAGCWIESFLCTVAMLKSDYVQSIRHGSNAYSLALSSGQKRRAIITALNVGDDFNSLNDHHAALEWTQRGMALARTTSWISVNGQALMQTAETLRHLRRFDAAADTLRDALNLLAPLAASRSFAVALQYLGDVELNRKHYASALDTFCQLEQQTTELGQSDLISAAMRGKAQALLELCQPEAALRAAETALQWAKAEAYRQIAALRVMAEIHARYTLAAPKHMSVASAPLHYLSMALDAAATIENYCVPADLLEEVAAEHAKIGDTGQAYALALQANRAREQIQSIEASNRASAMQVNHEAEKARVEAEHHKQLALASAERLQTLEQLGVVGREITGNLSSDSIFSALDRHVHALLDAFTFVIYRLSSENEALTMVFGVEAGQPVATHAIRLGDHKSNVAGCARDRTEIIANIPSGRGLVMQGTQETLSQMFAPLLIGDRLLGVMTIQSNQALAYAEREVAIFQTLCAYAAIALANAEAQAQLIEKNQQLETLSISDKLTGLYNRLRLDQVLKEEFARQKRSGAMLSVILLDVDHFKTVNDVYGHQVGDQVLIAIARILEEGSREVDVVGRWGGEEFMIVCRDTILDGAFVLAEKMRNRMAAHDFPIVGIKTCSFGVATLSHLQSIDALIATADAALYRAKNLGRNTVAIESQLP